MIKRFNFEIKLLKSQEKSLAKLFGCVRFVYNLSLNNIKENYSLGIKYSGYSELSSKLTQIKKKDEYEFLNEISCVPLQQSIRNLDRGFKNFFNSLTGKRKGKRVGHPRFKSKHDKQSAEFTKNGFKLRDGKLYLAKIGEIKVYWSRQLPNEPTSVTIQKNKSGKYFASFVCEVGSQEYPKNTKYIGIDLGIKDFATLSKGEKIKSPKPLKKDLKKLKRFQREYSRCEKGSKRQEKRRLRVAKLHQHISNIRLDFLHKTSTRLIQENQLLVLEDLNVSGMLKNRKLSRVISDLGLGRFVEMLISKAKEYGRQIVKVSRWFPSSKKCNACGEINSELTLADREWTCEHCGSIHDRDLNAARNILEEGLRLLNIVVAGGHSETLNEHGENVRLYNQGCKADLSEVLTP